MNGPAPASKLVTSDALTETYIFDTEAELLAFLEWDPDPDKPRVVPIRKEPT